MKVAILETGRPPGDLLHRFGDYPGMFSQLLGPAFQTASYHAAGGEFPEHPSSHDAYLVTGSPAGVYEDHEWIPPLKDFLRSAKGQAKLVGICFGHQIMAEAFGGRVAKSEGGWRVGLHRYQVIEAAPWMDEAPSFAIPVSHQDQVVEQPPNSSLVAGNAFTPFGLLAYEDQPAISFQGHPEFDPAYAQALIESRRERLPEPDAAIASLEHPNDRERVAGWIRRFLAPGPQ